MLVLSSCLRRWSIRSDEACLDRIFLLGDSHNGLSGTAPTELLWLCSSDWLRSTMIPFRNTSILRSVQVDVGESSRSKCPKDWSNDGIPRKCVLRSGVVPFACLLGVLGANIIVLDCSMPFIL